MPPEGLAPGPLAGRVLLVEDEPMVGEFMLELLQGWGDNAAYHAQFTYNGVPLKGHPGLDLLAAPGVNVLAADRGRVVALKRPPCWDKERPSSWCCR